MRLHPTNRGGVSCVPLQFMQMCQHHIRIAQRPELAAEALERLSNRPACLGWNDGLQKIQRRAQAACRHPRLVDRVQITLMQRNRHKLTKSLGEFIGIGRQGKGIGFGFAHEAGF